jgi:hypothetical protein
VLSNIYTYERLEDEVNYLTAVSEQEMQKRRTLDTWMFSDQWKSEMLFLLGLDFRLLRQD